ncbi:cytosine permease [Endozoicomonas sp. Mp262]|uniref:purine-cytosine permease family protein n=1 Tax=Endozoicomonas sp. Mp262 TaxID=2919499 RepID=UPI0021D919DC
MSAQTPESKPHIHNNEPVTVTHLPQPKVCEGYGLQPIPRESRTGGIWPLFNIFCNYFINPGTLLTSGMMVVAGLSFQATVIIQIIAAMTGTLPLVLFSRAGVRYGIPGQVFCRAVFGIRGSQWITSTLRLLCSIYWFAFQTAAGAMAIEAILRNCFEMNIPLWSVSLAFAIFQGVIAIIGYHYLKWLSVYTFPIKLITFIFLIVFIINHGGSAASPAAVLQWPGIHWSWILTATWFNTIFGSCLSIVTDASDFSRYTRSQRELCLGLLSGCITGITVGSIFGAYAVIAGGGSNINPFETISVLQPDALIILLIALVVFLDNWTINVINLYTGGLSLCNTWEKLGRVWATVLVTLIASILSCFPEMINSYTHIMGAVGALFAPITGVMLVWYFYQFKQIQLPGLYQKGGCYWYNGGFNGLPCLLIPMGFLLQPFLPIVFLPTLLIMSFSGLVYCLYRVCRKQTRSRLLESRSICKTRQ